MALGPALIGLIGTVVGVVGDREASNSKNELDAWMDSNKDLVQSNIIPIAVLGVVFLGGFTTIILTRKGKEDDA